MSEPAAVKKQTPGEALLITCLLLIAVIGFAYLFWPQYALFWKPVHTEATVLELNPRSVVYKFYVPSKNKTLFFERAILLHDSQKLKGHATLAILYPASNSDYVVIPALQRNMPVWIYIGIQLVALIALIQSVNTFRKSFAA